MAVNSPSFRVATDKKLIFTGDNPAIPQVIPHAKPLTHKGTQLLAMPHRSDETKLLNQLGYTVPSPFSTYYDWGRIPPFDHQRSMADLMVMSPRGYILAEPGLGKTRSAIAATDWLQNVENMGPVLVIAPLSILSATWSNEVFTWSNLECVVLHGSAAKRKQLLKTAADIYCINYDGVGVVLPELVNRRWGMIILDESTAVKNAGTKRFKVINTLVKNTKRVFALTGTPTPQGPMDAHGQLKMITPTSEVMFKTRFKQSVMYQVSQFTWLPKPDAHETVHRLMQPAAMFRVADCLNLPDIIYATRAVPLSPAQVKAYKQMETKLVADIASGTITAANSAVMMGKLVQICCGFLYDESGKAQSLSSTPRLKELVRTIDQTPGKTIVFAGHTASVNMVTNYLGTAGYSIAKVDGSVSSKDRAEIFSDFQNTGLPRVLVCQERTASHGLTLTKADQVIWYSLPTSYEVFTQANFRIRRPGQTRTHYVVALISSEIERRLLTRLRNRKSAQSLLLDMYQ